MTDEFININVDCAIKIQKEINSLNNNEDDVVNQEDYDNLRNLTKIICSPIYDENNYINGQFKQYKIDEETKNALIECCSKIEQISGLKKSDLDNYFIANIQLIINLRGNLISSENHVKILQSQCKDLYKQLKTCKNDCFNLNKMISEKEQDNQRLREKIKEQRPKKQNLQKNKSESKAIVVSQTINQNSEQNEKIVELEDIIKSKDIQLVDISKNLSETVLKNFEHEEKIKNIEKKLKEKTSLLNSTKNSSRSQINTLKVENDKLKAENETLIQENKKMLIDNESFKNIQAELIILKNQLESINKEYNMVLIEKKNLKFLNEKSSSDYSKLLVEYDKIKNIKTKYNSYITELDEYKRRYEELNINYLSINNGLTQSESKLLQVTTLLDEKNKMLDISEVNLKNAIEKIKTLESKINVYRPHPIDTKIMQKTSNIGSVYQISQKKYHNNGRRNRKFNGFTKNQPQINISSYATSQMTSPKVPQLIPITQEQFLQIQTYQPNQSTQLEHSNIIYNPYFKQYYNILSEGYEQDYFPYYMDSYPNYYDSNSYYNQPDDKQNSININNTEVEKN